MPTPDWLRIKLSGTILVKQLLFQTLYTKNLYFLNIDYQSISILRIFKVSKILTSTPCFFEGILIFFIT